MDGSEHAAALSALDEILRLKDEHDFEPPPEFWFTHARAALEAGAPARAEESATRYILMAGREAEFYREALQLLDRVEAAIEQTRLRAIEEKRLAMVAACRFPPSLFYPLTKFANDPVWGMELSHVATAASPRVVTWTGDYCSEDDLTAEGRGSIEIAYELAEYRDSVFRMKMTGAIQGGKAVGRWVIESWQEPRRGTSRETGYYSDGLKDGDWNEQYVWGAIAQTAEGRYREGRRSGIWKSRQEHGNDWEEWSGNFRDGKREGMWTEKTSNGYVGTIPYKRGQAHGSGTWERDERHGTTQYVAGRRVLGAEYVPSRYRNRPYAQRFYDDNGRTIGVLFGDGSCKRIQPDLVRNCAEMRKQLRSLREQYPQ